MTDPTLESPASEPTGDEGLDAAMVDEAESAADIATEHAADKAAMETIEDAFLAPTKDEQTQDGDKETSADTAEAIEPELLTAAQFAGMDEADLRDSIKTLGKDKAVKALQGLISKVESRWGVKPDAAANSGAPNAGAANGGAGGGGQQPATPAPSASQPSAGGAPQGQQSLLDQFASDDFGKDVLAEFPETKPVVEATRAMARQFKELHGQLQNALKAVHVLAGDHETSLANDLYDFYKEQYKSGFTAYGDPDQQPTPEQIGLRQRLFQAARSYQGSSKSPMRLTRALADAHAGLNIGKLGKAAAPASKSQATPAGKPARRTGVDVLPSSPGSVKPGATMAERDAAAKATLAKFGIR